MSFWPLFISEKFSSDITVHNFSPNNFETIKKFNYVNLSYIDVKSNYWVTNTIDTILNFESKTFKSSKLLKSSNFGVIQLSNQKINNKLSKTISDPFILSKIPAWRSTIRINNGFKSSSYQGELDIFPKKASMLSISPMIQNHSKMINNYLFFINLINEPVNSNHNLVMVDPNNPSIHLEKLNVMNNFVNIFKINKRHINSIYFFASKTLTGIPIFVSEDTLNNISIEHTHPVSQFFVHSNRFLLQRTIKDEWFKKIFK